MRSTQALLSLITSSLLILSINLDAMDSSVKFESEQSSRPTGINAPRKKMKARKKEIPIISMKTSESSVASSLCQPSRRVFLLDTKINNPTPPNYPPENVDYNPLECNNNTYSDEQPPMVVTKKSKQSSITSYDLPPTTNKTSDIEWTENDILTDSGTETDNNSDIDEETEVAAQYYTETWFLGDKIIINGLIWAKKQEIAEADRTTATKDMTDALRKLLTKNENDLKKYHDEKHTKLADLDETQIQLKQTECITSHLQLLEKNSQRTEAARFIIKNQSNPYIQLDELDLKAFHDACKIQENERISCLAASFSLGLHELERSNSMRSRTHKKSLKPEKIDYQPLDISHKTIFKAIMNKITLTSAVEQDSSLTDTEDNE